MPVTRENFDYELGASHIGSNWGDITSAIPEEDLDAAKDVVYRRVFDKLQSEIKKDRDLDVESAFFEAEKSMPDIRQIMGIAPRRTLQEQQKLLTPEAFKGYLEEQGDYAAQPDDKYDDALTDYISKIRSDKLVNPDFSQRSSHDLRSYFKRQAGDAEKIKDILEYQPPKEKTKQRNPKFGRLDPNSKTGVTEITEDEFNELNAPTTNIKSSFNRSWIMEDIQDATSRLANPITEEYYDIVGSEVPGIRQIDPKIVAQKRDIAAKDLIRAHNEFQKTTISPNIKKLMESPDFWEAAGNVNLETLADLVAESGVDVAEEMGAQGLGGLLGFLGTLGQPAGAIVGGSLLGGAVAGSNAFNSFFYQQMQKYAQKQKLPFNEDTVKKFLSDTETVANARRDAETSASILASAATASGLVGGFYVGALGKMMALGGFKPVIENGAIKVVQEVLKAADVAATSTAIELGGEVASKTVLGEEITPGELVAEAALSGAGAVVDIGTGVASRVGSNRLGDPSTVIVPQRVDEPQAEPPISATEQGQQGAKLLQNTINSISKSSEEHIAIPEGGVYKSLNNATGGKVNAILEESGQHMRFDENNELDTSDAGRVIADGFERNGLIEKRGGVYYASEGDNQAARDWAAEIANKLDHSARERSSPEDVVLPKKTEAITEQEPDVQVTDDGIDIRIDGNEGENKAQQAAPVSQDADEQITYRHKETGEDFHVEQELDDGRVILQSVSDPEDRKAFATDIFNDQFEAAPIQQADDAQAVDVQPSLRPDAKPLPKQSSKKKPAPLRPKYQVSRAQPVKTYSYSDQPGTNYIPPTIVGQVRADFPDAKFTGRDGNITGINIKQGDRTIKVRSKGSTSPLRESNRRFTVSIHTPQDRTKKGKKVALGGNKSFTIPVSVIPIESGDRFVDSVIDSAGAADLIVSTGENQPANERVVTTQDGEFVALVKDDNGTILIDNKPQRGLIGFSKTLPTEKEQINAALNQQAEVIDADMQIMRSFRPKSRSAQEKMADSIDSRHDVLDETFDTVVVGRHEHLVQTGGNVKLHVVTDNDPNVLLRNARIDSFRKDAPEIEVDSVDELLNALPPQIRDVTEIQNWPDNDAIKNDAYGFFHPDYNGNGPKIIIDGHNRTPSQMAGVLAEEVAHFAFNLWAGNRSSKEQQKFFDMAYKTYQSDIETHLGEYLDFYNVDRKNPADIHKFILVNELFSKQNTTFMDLVNDGVAPGDISREALQRLKQQGKEYQKEFVFNLGESPDVRKFAEEILKAQSRSVTGKSAVFDFKVSRNGEERTLRIIPTAVGQARTVSPEDPYAIKQGQVIQTYATAKERSVKDYLKEGGNPLRDLKVRKFMNSLNVFGNPVTGRFLNRVIADAAFSAKRAIRPLLPYKAVAQRMDAMLRDEGVDPSTVSDYSLKLRELGITDKRKLQLAAEADEFMSDVKNMLLRGSERIRHEYRKSTNLLREKGDGVPPEILGSHINELENIARRLKPDYKRARYTAYEEPSDMNVLKEIMEDVQGRADKPLSLQAQRAEEEIARINASKLSDRKKRRKIEAQRKIISKYERMKHLERHVRLKAAENNIKLDPQGVNDEMVQVLSIVMKKADYKYMNGIKSVDQISGSREVKIDPNAGEGTSDYHKAKFLGRIESPIEVAIFSLLEQQQVYSGLRSANKLADELLHMPGVAAIDGDVNSNILKRDTELAQGNQNNILKYLNIEPVLDDAIQSQSSYYSRMNEYFVSRAIHEYIGAIKTSATVGNLGTHIRNLISVPYFLFGNGHIFYLLNPKNLAEFTSSVGNVWRNRNGDVTGEKYIKKLAQEMYDNDVFQTGAQAGIIEFSHKQQLIQRFAKMVYSDLPNILGGTDEKAVLRADRVERTYNWLVDAYSMSDDIPKILSYMIDRDIAEAKAKATIKKEGFATQRAWEDAVERATIREAVDRTRRQYSDFGNTADIIKNLTTGNARVAINDFVTYTAQLVKMQGESIRVWLEDMSNSKRAFQAGQKEYANKLALSVATRFVGKSSIVYTGYGFATGGYFALQSGLWEALEFMGYLDEDDENFYTDEQRQAAGRVYNRYKSFDGSAYADILPYKDGENIYAWNVSTHDPNSPIIPPPTIDNDPLRQFSRAAKNVFTGGDSGTMYYQVLQAVMGKDWKGDNIETNYAANLAKVAASQALPRPMQQAWELYYGESFLSGNPKPRFTTLSSMAGNTVNTITFGELVSLAGRDISRNIGTSETFAGMKRILKKGGASTTQEERGFFDWIGSLNSQNVYSMVQGDIQHSQKLMSQYRALIRDIRTEGTYNDKQIQQHLMRDYKTKAVIMSEDNAERIMKGENIFMNDAAGKLKKLQKKVEDYRTTATFTKEAKQRAIKNIKTAIEFYERDVAR